MNVAAAGNVPQCLSSPYNAGAYVDAPLRAMTIIDGIGMNRDPFAVEA